MGNETMPLRHHFRKWPVLQCIGTAFLNFMECLYSETNIEFILYQGGHDAGGASTLRRFYLGGQDKNRPVGICHIECDPS